MLLLPHMASSLLGSRNAAFHLLPPIWGLPPGRDAAPDPAALRRQHLPVLRVFKPPGPAHGHHLGRQLQLQRQQLRHLQ